MTRRARATTGLLMATLLAGACSATISQAPRASGGPVGRTSAGDPPSDVSSPSHSAGGNPSSSNAPSVVPGSTPGAVPTVAPGSTPGAVPTAAPSAAAVRIGAHVVPNGATAAVDAESWSLADRISAPTYSTDTTLAFEQALARAGIAVVADTSTDPATAAPEVALSGTQSPLELLDFQAHNLAVGAWAGAGWTGAELDQLVPLPAGSDGVPSLADLLAGYVASADTPGGAFSRALMAGQNLMDPLTARYPTVVMALFVSDLAVNGSSAGSPSPSSSPAAVNGPPADTTALNIEPAVDVGLICAGPSAWIDAVVNRLEEAIAAATPPSTIGGIIFGVIHWLVHVAVTVVKGLVEALTAPVLTAIRSFAAIATGIVQQIASVMPFSVQVIAGHTQTADGATFFLNATPQGGVYTAYVTAGDLPDWPAVVKVCAQAAGITLPDFASKNVPLTFGPVDAPGDTLISPNGGTATAAVTDQTGKATWPFVTAVDPGDPTGEQLNQFDWMPVAVHRPELDDLKAQLTRTLLADVPEIARGFVGSLFEPLLDDIQQRLNAILDARGSGPAIIVYHAKAQPTPAPSVTPGPSATACAVTIPAGTYNGQLTSKSTTLVPPGQIDLGESGTKNSDGVGPLAVTVAADGTFSGTFGLADTEVQVYRGLAEGSDTTVLDESGTVSGSPCALTLHFVSETIASCTKTGHGLCGGVGGTYNLSGLVPPLPLGAPASVSGGTLTWSISSESETDAGFGGLSADVQETITATLQAP